MRWKNNNSLKVGQTRTVRKFLWIPRSLGETETRWLEFADIEEVVVRRNDFENACSWKEWQEVALED